MRAFLDTLPILTVFPYALLYYLILLAASGLSFLAIQKASNSQKSPRSQTLSTALLILFFSQLLLLTLSLLIQQGASPLEQIFPLAQRSLTLITLIWLVWALLDFRPQNWLRHIPLGMTILVFLLGCLAIPYWSSQVEITGFNDSWMDRGWSVAALVVLLIGVIIYTHQNRARKAEGILILAIAALGFLIYLLFPNSGSVPGAVMLSQLLYYPLLISIAWQTASAHQLESSAEKQNLLSQAASQGTSPQVAAAFLDVGLQTEINPIYKALTHGVGLFLLAELCGVAEENTNKDGLIITGTYDLIREEYLPPFELSAASTPTLKAHFEDGLPLLINGTANLAEEKKQILQAVGYNQLGNLLLYPLNAAKTQTRFALLCLSPYTDRQWTQEDQDRLTVISSRLEQILKDAANVDERTKASDNLRISVNQLKRERTQIQEQLSLSQILLDDLRQEYQQNKTAYNAEIQIWVERQKLIEEELASLSKTIADNKAALEEAELLKTQKNNLEQTLAKNSQHIASLRDALENARNVINQLVITTEPEQEASTSSLEPSALESIEIEEQPLQIKSTDSEAALKALRATIRETATSFASRKIKLTEKMDVLPVIPGNLLPLLQEVLTHLEINALSASPDQGEVIIEISPEESETEPPSIEIRVIDQGGGLSEQEQVQFINLLSRSGFPMPAGVGDAKALREALLLVQQARGHWWIHSQVGQPTTYRVSLPLEINPGNIET